MAGNPTELRATMADIEADPDSWDQSVIARVNECGTKFCFAGRTLYRHGYRPVVGLPFAMLKPGSDQIVSFPLDVAAGLLGLDPEGTEALVLFAAYNTNSVAEMRAIIEAIIADDDETIARYL